MDLRLSGSIAVVTGAAKGIGLAVTRTLLQEGARVVATSRARTPELDALDGELLHVAADLTDPGAPAHVIASAVERFGGLDERGGGSIVNVTSGHARQPSAANVDYGAAKAALTNLTKALSEEFGAQGVRVNSVCPGPVNTPWWTEEGGAADIIAAQTGADRAALMTTVAPQMMRLATGRLAEAQEIADAVVLLASPRSGSTTGSEFVVDSGFLKAS